MALNNRQIAAIPVIIGCDTVLEAARQTGVARGTLHGWLKQDEFQKAVSDARKKLLDKAMNRLMSATMQAVITLEALLNAESEAVRRAAANDILGHSLKYRELSELEDRLEVVERIIFERRTFK
jgi:hypothetical protein